MRQSLLPLLILVFAARGQVEPGAPQTPVDRDSSVTDRGSTAGRQQKTGDKEDHDLHVINPSRTDLREYLERTVVFASAVENCAEWSADDSRIGMLVPGASRLFIGRPNPDADGIGVKAIEKDYEVSSVAIGGSPFEGNVQVMLEAGEVRVERMCLEKLRGAAIRWDRSIGDPSYPDIAGEVIVRDVKFSRAARLERGEVVATGAFVATLKVSEGAVAMVLREMRAHFWGIFGSFLLMVCATVGRRLMPSLRRAMGGARVKLDSPSWKRFRRQGQPEAADVGDSVPEEPRDTQARATDPDINRKGATEGNTDAAD